jgi:hypothetical protein
MSLSILADTQAESLLRIGSVMFFKQIIMKRPDALETKKAVAIGLLSDLIPSAKDNVLCLLLDTLELFLSDSVITLPQPEKLILALLNVWSGHQMDSLVQSSVLDLLEHVSNSPNMFGVLLSLIGPSFGNIIRSYDADDAQTVSIVAGAIDLVTLLVKKDVQGSAELYRLIEMALSFFTGARLVDSSIIQNASQLIKALFTHQDAMMLQSQQFFDSSLRFLTHVLVSDQVSDDGVVFVGDALMAALIRGENHNFLRSVLPNLLTSASGRLKRCQSPLTSQNLLKAISLLFEIDSSLVLNVLSQSQSVDFILRLWLENFQDVHGYFATRIKYVVMGRMAIVIIHDSIMAVCKLFVLNDPRVANLLVKGDRIMDASGKIVTRSRARQERWTEVSATIKMLKILLLEYQEVSEETKPGTADVSFGDNESEEWEDEDEMENAMDALAAADGVNDKEDSLIAENTRFNIQVKPYITEFFRALSQQEGAAALFHHLSEDEKLLVRQMFQ